MQNAIIISKYLFYINQTLEKLYKQGVLNKSDCEKSIKKFLESRKEFIKQEKKNLILLSYKLKFVTKSELGQGQKFMQYSNNYEVEIEKNQAKHFEEYRIIYTTAKDKELKNFDFDSIYFLYNCNLIPDESYSYLIKEYTICVYINDENLKCVEAQNINVQIA